MTYNKLPKEEAVMMGVQDRPQDKLFYTHLNLEQRVRKNHPLRKIAELIDFTFVYKEVEDTYGTRGNVSVPPPVILKLMLLLVFYNVRSERELMDTVAERLDWLWFLGYDLDSEIPNHSVLSKARKRWGLEVFQRFFERIVEQCVEAGLVDGRKIFVDSSLVDADASKNSVIDTRNLKHQLRKNYKELEARLEERNQAEEPCGGHKRVNKRYISGTDPDATIVRRGEAKLRYQAHRAVEESHEIITATEATAGDVNEAHLLEELLEKHRSNTAQRATTAVADSKYGTVDNFLLCHDKGVKAHMPDLGEAARGRNRKRNIFPDDRFLYDKEQDLYICPAGQKLKRKSVHKRRKSMDYGASKKVCASCDLRDQCTRNKSGRTVKRHFRQEALDRMRQGSRSPEAKKDIKTRTHLMERSFARSTRYGYQRARWRGLWRMQIQEYLICSIQNIQVLIKSGAGPTKASVRALRATKQGIVLGWNAVAVNLGCFLRLVRCQQALRCS